MEEVTINGKTKTFKTIEGLAPVDYSLTMLGCDDQATMLACLSFKDKDGKVEVKEDELAERFLFFKEVMLDNKKVETPEEFFELRNIAHGMKGMTNEEVYASVGNAIKALKKLGRNENDTL